MSVSDNLKKIKSTLPKNVKLVAVSKFHSAEDVIKCIKAGQNVFGENKIQEAAQKFDYIRSLGFTPELYIIGQLQRNKVKHAVRIASMIQSVDRVELVEEIEKQCSLQNKTIQILFEIHTAEDSKSGFTDLNELFELLDGFEKRFPHIKIKGFMTMAPFTDDKNLIENSFKKIKELQNKAKENFPSLDFSELSMGMSNDYKIAIENGSTMVRIGTAIFGERNYGSK